MSPAKALREDKSVGQQIDDALMGLVIDLNQDPGAEDVQQLRQINQLMRQARRKGIRLAFDAIRRHLGKAAYRATNTEVSKEAAAILHHIIDSTTALQAEVELQT